MVFDNLKKLFSAKNQKSASQDDSALTQETAASSASSQVSDDFTPPVKQTGDFDINDPAMPVDPAKIAGSGMNTSTVNPFQVTSQPSPNISEPQEVKTQEIAKQTPVADFLPDSPGLTETDNVDNAQNNQAQNQTQVIKPTYSPKPNYPQDTQLNPKPSDFPNKDQVQAPAQNVPTEINVPIVNSLQNQPPQKPADLPSDKPPFSPPKTEETEQHVNIDSRQFEVPQQENQNSQSTDVHDPMNKFYQAQTQPEVKASPLVQELKPEDNKSIK